MARTADRSAAPPGPCARLFTISRGSRTAAETLTAEIRDDEWGGRGANACPTAAMARISIRSRRQIESVRGAVEGGLDRAGLQDALPAGAARNALDLRAVGPGGQGRRHAGLAPRRPSPNRSRVVTCYTISLDSEEKMAADAAEAAARGLSDPQSSRLTGDGDLGRVQGGAPRRARGAPGGRPPTRPGSRRRSSPTPRCSATWGSS